MKKFEAALKKHLDIFINQEMYFVNDLKNMELFRDIPHNTNAEDIRTKLSAMNDTDISHNALMEDTIKHIINLKVDERIGRGDLSVVEDISNISTGAKTFHFLHFASTFCNFHKPDLFPIYSEQHFDFYRLYIKENNLPLDPEKLSSYDVFSKALDDLVRRLDLRGKMDYLQIRKFGWLYADLVLKEAND